MSIEEVSTPRTRRRETWGHALAISASLAVAGSTILEAPSSPGNIAPEAKATMSSNCGLEPAGQPGPVRPELLVDGRRTRFYDACTKTQRAAWARLEFTHARQIRAIKVFGRGDCCWDLMGFPLVAEVSADGVVFGVVARRELPFTRRDPWEIELDTTSAKVVRIRAESARASLVLSEIEVLESP